MFIGVPKEIKTDEYRVSLTPETVKALTARGNRVAVETMAGRWRRHYRRGIHCRRRRDHRGCRSDISARRTDREGQGAAGIRTEALATAARSSSPICTWRPTPNRPMT